MKVFVISDIHSNYTDTINALNKKGFEKNREDHLLIINGDVFDRGDESQRLRDFLDSTKNKICIFGNHELLMLDVIRRGQFLSHDLSNGTVDAAIQLTGGYDLYPELGGVLRASLYFKKTEYMFDNSLINLKLQKKIISNLIETNIVEWIVDNFYIDNKEEKKSVIWNDEKTKFFIKGKPRYYLQIKDRLFMHGFFPSPDWIKNYTSVTSGILFKAELPDDFDILEESTEEMWEEYGCGIWSNTPYWLKNFYKYKLDKLYAYIVRKNIKHIYIGHHDAKDLENMVVSVSMSPTYMAYHDKLPKWYFTDSKTFITHKVIVETFEIDF